MTEDGPLDAEVVGDHVERSVANPVRLRGRDLGGQIDAVGAGLVPGQVFEGGLVDGARAAHGTEGAWHGAGVTDVAGEPPGVDSGEPG